MAIERRMKSKDVIELGLGSIGKVRIMRALAEEDKMATIYGIHKKTRLKREDIKRNLDDLMKIGWVVRPEGTESRQAQLPWAKLLLVFGFLSVVFFVQPIGVDEERRWNANLGQDR